MYIVVDFAVKKHHMWNFQNFNPKEIQIFLCFCLGICHILSFDKVWQVTILLKPRQKIVLGNITSSV